MQVQCEEFQGHSTASKCIYLLLNHGLEGSNHLNSQSSLKLSDDF